MAAGFFKLKPAICLLFLCTIAVGVNAVAVGDHGDREYKIDPKAITTSGISSGGAMATQLHFAHSSVFSGVGVLSGIPYWCAADNLAVAMTLCMKYPGLINTDVLYGAIQYAATLYSIDNPQYLKNSKVFIFQGTDDSIVVPGVADKIANLYKYFLSSGNIKYLHNIKAEHSIVTNDFGNECSFLGAPFINNCNFDTAGALFDWIYGNMTAATPYNKDNVISFDQGQFMPTGIIPPAISMAHTGFAYIPTGCNSTKTSPCKLHVALHGCKQYADTIGQSFVLNAGYNGWAEANNIIILYPQTIASNLPYNPDGCWDWFAYTGPEYATKLAPQIITIMNMIAAFRSP